MDFSNLVTREIDKRFCYIQYDDFELIMMKENKYVNATKLCKLGGKEFKKWMRLEGSKELIKKAEETTNIWKLKPARPDLAQLEMVINVESSGKNGKKYEVAGSYVHQDLLPHVASWISPLARTSLTRFLALTALRRDCWNRNTSKSVTTTLPYATSTLTA